MVFAKTVMHDRFMQFILLNRSIAAQRNQRLYIHNCLKRTQYLGERISSNEDFLKPYKCNFPQARLFQCNNSNSYAMHKTISTSSQTIPIADIIKQDMDNFFKDIRKLLESKVQCDTLREMSNYNFDGSGKSIRPAIVFLMARTCNAPQLNNSVILPDQLKIAQIAELIHTGSLVHDDVVDASFMRRGKNSINMLCGDKKAVLAGNYIMGKASEWLASIENNEIVEVMSTIIIDLVRGEFMQEDSSNNFDQYLSRIYKKTASLIANSCKSVAIQSGASNDIINAAFCFGRDIGIAFQLVDDLLDFEQTDKTLGKPSAADLKLGLATAPVLFASEKHSYLHDMILRKFKREGDVEAARKAVADSDGVKETKLLAQQYCQDACRHLQRLKPSNERDALIKMTDTVLNRTK